MSNNPAKSAAPANRTTQRQFSSLPEALTCYAGTQPDQLAILAPGRKPLSYGALWRRTTDIVTDLRGFGISSADRVAVVLPNGADAAVATVAVACGAVCVPLHAGFSSDEVRRALTDLEVAALLTSPAIESVSRSVAYAMGLPVIDVTLHPHETIGFFDLTCSTSRPAVRCDPPQPSDDAFVLLTSGSTAQPKLVPLTQAGICHSAYCVGLTLALQPDDRLINVQPVTHAHGLFSGLLAALVSGSSVVCPNEFEATAFLDWLTTFGATWYTAVPPIHRALIAAARRRKEAVRTSLRFIRSASSPLPISVLDELESLFGVPVIETYGMTEAASQIAANPPELRKRGSVGKSAGAAIALVDDEGRPLATGQRGEVVLRGPAITRGYTKNERATRAAFRDGWFRTGDLGYLDSDGYLFLLGRINKADIINRGGQKVSPKEVENALMGHPDVAEARVFPIPHTRLGEDVAAAVIARPQHKIDVKKLRRFASERLARFKVPGLIRVVAAFPADDQGDIARSELAGRLSIAMPRSHIHSEGHLVPPRSETEWQLARMWADLLGLAELGVNEDVFALGADSLTITQLIARLRARFAANVTFKDIFDAPSVAALAYLIDKRQDRTRADRLQPAMAPDQNGPLSLQQQRIHLLGAIDPISSKYHVISGMVLSGALDHAALDASLATICWRHETLRSIFPERHGDVTQSVTTQRARLERIDLRHVPRAAGRAAVQAHMLELLRSPFEIETTPPVRIQLLELGDDHHILLVKLHHLITDGWSHRLFFSELETLYNARRQGLPCLLDEPPLQYRHYVQWQREWLATPAAAAQLSYWHKRLEGLTELPLRTDRPRPEQWSGRGARVPLRLTTKLSNRLRTFSRANHVSLFMTLLGAFQCLLARYTDHFDIAVGSLIANRSQLETERLIGMFANAIVLRTDLTGDPSFQDVLKRVRDVTLEAYRNQELPIEEILRTLRLPRSLDRNPLFRVMFILQKAAKPLDLQGLEISTIDPDPGIARSDLVLELIDDAGALNGWLEYSTELFEPATIERMAMHFRNLLEQILACPDLPFSDLPLLSAAEERRILDGAAAAPAAVVRTNDFLARFARHVDRTPAAPAVSCGETRLSYAELAQKAGGIASRLKRLSVNRGEVVVLFAERGADLVAAMIAVQQCGAAFLPLDPAVPAMRQVKILEHSAARIVLAMQRTMASLQSIVSDMPRKAQPRILLIDDIASAGPVRVAPPRRAPSSLACIIYTSGSTGEPKGAMIAQRGMVNHLLSKISDLDLSAGDVIAQTSPQSFVIAIWQCLAPLMVGARVQIVEDHAVQDAALLVREMAREGTTVLEIVPSQLRALLQPEPEASTRRALGQLRALISTGESLAPDLCADWFGHFPGVPLINAYGATECSDDVATHRMTAPPAASATVPIGRPIANVRLHVLDRRLRPAPIGVAGELFVGGVAVGLGYYKDPGQTRSRFLPEAYSRTRGARLYRTGDLARWRADGTLECFGRVDHQVKIRGCRVELEDVEHALAQHPAVRTAAVVARETRTDDMQLTAYVVTADGTPPDIDELNGFMRARLPGHMIPAGYVVLDQLPVTAHGKLDRSALAAVAAVGSVRAVKSSDDVRPRTPTERLLAAIWTDVLGHEVSGVTSNFFDLGGHSLLAGRVLARVASALGVTLPIRALFEASTIEALALRIDQARALAMPRAPDVPHRPEAQPAISIQQDQIVRTERELPGLPRFNLPYAFRLRGALDVAALERSLVDIVRRHDSLRAGFGWEHDGPRALVLEPSAVTSLLDVENLSMAAPAGDRRAQALVLKKAELRIAQEAWRPFELARAPLLRARLLRLGPDDHVLLLIMHHLIVDGWSMGVLFEEIAMLYAGHASGRDEALPRLEGSFFDFAAQQTKWCASETAAGQLAEWKNRLRGAPPVFTAPGVGAGELLSSRIDTETFHLRGELIDRLSRLSRGEGATLFMALLAGFKAMLALRTGRRDVCVGTTMANRVERWTERIVGPVENTTIIRSQLDADLSFRDILRSIRQGVLEAHARQELPFETLVAELSRAGDLDPSVLVQVFFVFQNAIPKPFTLSGLAVERFDSATAQGRPVLPVDGSHLAIMIEETATGIGGACIYKSDLIETKTVKAWLRDYAAVLAQAVETPDRPVRLPQDSRPAIRRAHRSKQSRAE
ncbi:amino acid adenylation domain-containing protein [Bradyrhizobium sp. HKCCYLS20291]|uniref:amino acid adenylation domain-containing protein n=1 Tax=Bradyrhizobium sp. HKCCYLS20291 TaxID=3420766 RepID=UPI003EB6EF0E